MFSKINILASAALLSLAGAVVLKVDVGLNGLTFTPSSIPAAMGDVVEFHFYPKNHSVVQTSFASPCQFNSPSDFNSGFMPVKSGTGANVFQVTVTTESPIWFYCGQARHCESGMVGVINEPTSGNKTLAAFAAKAVTVGNTTNPSTVQGGVIAANTDLASTASGSVGLPSSTSLSSPQSSYALTSSAVATRAMRWSEFLGIGVAIGAAALLM